METAAGTEGSGFGVRGSRLGAREGKTPAEPCADGPVAMTQNSEVVGVFMSPDEYDALFGHEIAAPLKSREKGPTVSHEEVCRRARQIIARRRTS